MTTQNFKPILSYTEMVQAILEGRKTQTRRVLGYSGKCIKCGCTDDDCRQCIEKTGEPCYWVAGDHLLCSRCHNEGVAIIPKYQKGDILWVRESGKIFRIKGVTGFHYSGQPPVVYKSIEKIGIEYCDGVRSELDFPERLKSNIKVGQKLPYGIFKEAARIFLEVTDVRVERLQDISEEDAIAEGVFTPVLETYPYAYFDYIKSNYIGFTTAKESFQSLWQKINGKKHPWESNPWVWVYSFKRIEKPENF